MNIIPKYQRVHNLTAYKPIYSVHSADLIVWFFGTGVAHFTRWSFKPSSGSKIVSGDSVHMGARRWKCSIMLASVGSSFVTDEKEMEHIGISTRMDIVHMPRSNLYWGVDRATVSIDTIADVMTSNSFKELNQFLHFNDNAMATPRRDGIWSILQSQAIAYHVALRLSTNWIRRKNKHW